MIVLSPADNSFRIREFITEQVNVLDNYCVEYKDIDILLDLRTNNHMFRSLHKLSNYKKCMTASEALYQEIQLVLYKPEDERDTFNKWTYSLVMNNIKEIIEACEYDINNLFFQLIYGTIPEDYNYRKLFVKILEKLQIQLYGYKQLL